MFKVNEILDRTVNVNFFKGSLLFKYHRLN
jgi:hypothetical protein